MDYLSLGQTNGPLLLTVHDNYRHEASCKSSNSFHRTSQTPENKVATKSTPQKEPPLHLDQGKDFKPFVEPALTGNRQTSRLSDPVLSGGASQAQSSSQVHHGIDSSHVISRHVGFNERQYRSELNEQNHETELKEMVGKIHDVENEKYKVEMEMANRVAELETKVR